MDGQLELTSDPSSVQEQRAMLSGHNATSPNEWLAEETTRQMQSYLETRNILNAASALPPQTTLSQDEASMIAMRVYKMQCERSAGQPSGILSTKSERKEAREAKSESAIKAMNAKFEAATGVSDFNIGQLSPHAFVLKHGYNRERYRSAFNELVTPVLQEFKLRQSAKAKHMECTFRQLRTFGGFMVMAARTLWTINSFTRTTPSSRCLCWRPVWGARP